MVETTILIPGQAIEIPDELQDMFDVVRHTFDLDTPIRKTTELVEDANYSTVGNVVSTDGFFVQRLGNADFHPALAYGVSRLYAPAKSATSIIRGRRDDQFAKLAFAESHVSEEAASFYQSGLCSPQVGSSIWQLGIELSTNIGRGRRSFTTIGANSMGEAVGKTEVWSQNQQPVEVQTEYLFSTERFAEIATAAARILIPPI